MAVHVPSAVADGALGDLSELRWKRRVLLAAPQPAPNDTIATLRANAPSIDDRDLTWFVWTGASLETNYSGPVSDRIADAVRGRLQVDPLLLIGKDGGIKLRAAQLDLDAIFTRIDSMPMRQREMKRGSRADQRQNGFLATLGEQRP